MTHPIFTGKFWADAVERIVATAAQAALGMAGAGGLFDHSYSITAIAEVAVSAAVICLLKCLAATQVGADNTAALLPAGPDTEAGHADTALITCLCIVVIAVVFLLWALGVVPATR